MTRKLRVARNPEANELSAHIQNDAAMMSVLSTAIHEFHNQCKAEFAAAGQSDWDPSPMLLPPTTDLIIALIERKVATLKAFPNRRQIAVELEVLSKKASLYPVADDILQTCLPMYRPMSQTGRYEIINLSADAKKPWWRFW